MVSVVVSLALGLVLIAAAGSKAVGGATARAALATYGLRSPRAASAVWGVLIAVELLLGLGVGAGSALAANCAAVLMAGACLAQVGAILSGRAGAPCGCFGSKGTVGRASAGRAAALAAALAVLPLLPREEPTTEGWLAIGLAIALLGLIGLAVVVLALAPAIEGFGAHPSIILRTFDEVEDADAWSAADVPGSPFAVALDADGTVLAKGTFNTGAQLESVLAAAERRRGLVRA
jgi:hypothetical protein